MSYPMRSQEYGRRIAQRRQLLLAGINAKVWWMNHEPRRKR
jgi:hypothetical protein